jgi:DNA-binding transcriptional regulator YdaS (Cro superfamily)
MSETWDPALQRAIDAIGGTAALAAELGIRAPSIYSWRRTPPERVLAVEKATGISRYELRPDIYPPPAPRRRAS